MSNVLEVQGVSKKFGAKAALTDMNLSVKAGELFGFVGGNGSGKTTTMRIILGVLEADSGTVKWSNELLDLSRRRRFGYMPEERGVYSKMKVAEQLTYFAEAHGLSSKDAAAAADKWLERLGVAQYSKDAVEKLSLGNQQRVQLAVALVHEPEVLILDEPFSGLDPIAVDVMTSVLRERAAAGVAVMFSSHQLELVEQLCDRVGIVREGHIEAAGTIEELRGSSTGQWVIDLGETSTEWLRSASYVKDVEVLNGKTVVSLREGQSEQQLLQAAIQAGPVRGFRPYERSLSEVYRSVVATTVGEEAK